MRASFLISAMLLTGCATPEPVLVGEVPPEHYSAIQSERDIHSYAKQIVVEMLDTMQPLNSQAAIAIGTFLPATDFTKNTPTGPALGLGNQLQESMQTLFTQVGARVIEFRANDEISLYKDQDVMLTKDVELLKKKLQVDYYLTGTITHQQNGFLVNSKLVALDANQIIAAASQLIPANVMWETEKVTQRDGLLYRSEN